MEGWNGLDVGDGGGGCIEQVPGGLKAGTLHIMLAGSGGQSYIMETTREGVPCGSFDGGTEV